jgi:hypothetical protein
MILIRSPKIQLKVKQLIQHWSGYEAAALKFLFVDWVISYKKKKKG